jgi:DnaK suppressor protein
LKESVFQGGSLMDKKKLDYYKDKLLKLRQTILNSGILTNTEDMHVASEDLADEADLANNHINQQISFSIRERELTKLKRIDAALSRIEDGSFGFCAESGEEIEPKRLENQPWAEFCLEVAEEKEREAMHTYRKA